MTRSGKLGPAITELRANADANGRPRSGSTEKELRSTGNARERHGLFRYGAF